MATAALSARSTRIQAFTTHRRHIVRNCFPHCPRSGDPAPVPKPSRRRLDEGLRTRATHKESSYVLTELLIMTLFVILGDVASGRFRAEPALSAIAVRVKPEFS